MKFKYALSLLLIIAITICGVGCSKEESKTDTLTGDDLVAYNLMLEVCKVANDPTETFIISGTVTDGDAGGAIKVKSSGQISYVIVSYENGKAVCSDGREAANYSAEMMEMFTNTSDFNAAKVNQALKEHWGIDRIKY